MVLVKEFLRDKRIVAELNRNDYTLWRYLAVLSLSREPPHDANFPIEGHHWLHYRQVETVGRDYGLDIDRFHAAKEVFTQLEKIHLVKGLPAFLKGKKKVGNPFAATDAGYQFILERLESIKENVERRMEYETMNLSLAKNPVRLPKGLTEIPLEAGKDITIGRVEENDYCFPRDKTMSRRHARVFSRDGKFWIEDNRSTNGTWKLDKNYPMGLKRVQVEEIRDKDEFKLGQTLIRLMVQGTTL
jgi:hypothetical protein